MRRHRSLREERLKSHDAIFRSTLLDGHATDVSGSDPADDRGVAQGGIPASRDVRREAGPGAASQWRSSFLEPPSAPVGRPAWGTTTRTSPRHRIRVGGAVFRDSEGLRTGQNVSGHE